MKAELITVAKAAKLKGCSRQAIHAAIKAKRITAVAEPVTTVLWKVDTKSLEGFTPNPRMKRTGRPRTR